MLQTLKDCATIKECNNLRDKYIENLSTTIDFNTVSTLLCYFSIVNLLMILQVYCNLSGSDYNSFLIYFHPVSTNFSIDLQLPKLQDKFDSLTDILTVDFIKEIQRGQNSLRDKKDEINKIIKENMGEVQNAIKNAGKELEYIVSNTTRFIHNTQDKFINKTFYHIDNAEGFLRHYSLYRHYASLGVSCILLLVTICIDLGFIFGICGKRSDLYSDNCCSKGPGRRFSIWCVSPSFDLRYFKNKNKSISLKLLKNENIQFTISVGAVYCSFLHLPSSSSPQ